MLKTKLKIYQIAQINKHPLYIPSFSAFPILVACLVGCAAVLFALKLWTFELTDVIPCGILHTLFIGYIFNKPKAVSHTIISTDALNIFFY